MLKPLLTAIVLTATLTGCGAMRDSAVNPFNWFGRSQEVPVEASDAAAVNPLIPETRRGLFAGARERRNAAAVTSPIDQITDLRIERVPGGAIIRATGLDTAQGTFNAGLLPSNPEDLPVDGVLTYTFERQLPPAARTGGPVASREITVARKLTDQQLRTARSIRVVASGNARAVRR